jgi:two-component sensor histidine kinase
MWARFSRASGATVNDVDLSDRLRKFWHDGLVPGSPAAYLLAIGCVTVASLLNWALWLLDSATVPFVPYLPAVLVASMLGGTGAGGLAVAASAIVAWWFFPSHYYGNGVAALTQAVNLALFVAAAALTLWAVKDRRGYPIQGPHVDTRAVGTNTSRLASFPPSLPLVYVFAVACVAVSTIVRFAFGWLGGEILLFASYFPAVLIVTMFGGAGPGIFSIVLSMVVVDLAFVPPDGFAWPTRSHTISLVYFLSMASLTVWVAESYRRVLRRLHEAEVKQKFLLREVEHRSKNIFAVVQSIVSQSLHANKEEARKINGRIHALAATNDLLTGSADQVTDLETILRAEFEPYAVGRIVMDGGRMNLRGDLAKPLALVFHELATNAAKYGSLSEPGGVLKVCWEVLGGRAEIRWIEQGGPAVVPPTKQGFGTQFIGQILKTLEGAVATEFLPSGVECKISFLLPESMLRGSV